MPLHRSRLQAYFPDTGATRKVKNEVKLTAVNPRPPHPGLRRIFCFEGQICTEILPRIAFPLKIGFPLSELGTPRKDVQDFGVGVSFSM